MENRTSLVEEVWYYLLDYNVQSNMWHMLISHHISFQEVCNVSIIYTLKYDINENGVRLRTDTHMCNVNSSNKTVANTHNSIFYKSGTVLSSVCALTSLVFKVYVIGIVVTSTYMWRNWVTDR